MMTDYMSLEDVATYVQGVDDVERGAFVEAQGAKIADALKIVTSQPEIAEPKIEHLLKTEALDPASRALLELHQLGMSMRRDVSETREPYGETGETS
jgi:hypothetical protein